jgi:rhodanese-related sulfurtransferase
MKKVIISILLIICMCGCTKETLSTLPQPELSEGQRGQLGIDKNINESTIDNYLNREDSVYRDMRMLKDDGIYENIGGDSYISGLVKGFEVVPYPYLAPLFGLPEEIGEGYTGKTLFRLDENDKYVANYKESLDILEYLFPKDKNIFLMCGGGGYAGFTKNLLVSLGWDENKIYNVGGYWYYEGKNNVEVKTTKYGETSYQFYKIPYHNIDFDSLHEA